MDTIDLHLRKLLVISYAPPKRVTSMLREKIRSDRGKAAGPKDGGGDFHLAFWSDAKAHARGDGDLRKLVEARVTKSKQRARLYPQLETAFLRWWNEKRRWINEPFLALERPINARLPIGDLKIKVENFLAVEFGDGSHRLVYPYFDEKLPLNDEAARIGLWVLTQAIPHEAASSFRILDVLRSKTFSIEELPLRGDEEESLKSQHDLILRRYRQLLLEYT